MKAMVLNQQQTPLVMTDIPRPEPGPGEVLIRVTACAVCRTDLHILDGDLTQPKLPLIPGHEIVGKVVETGQGVVGLNPGDRVGVPWLGYTCGHCHFCDRHEENLCDHAKFTGYDIDGGYAEYTVANHQFVFPLPDNFNDVEVAPFLCAGLIGYRSYKMAGKCDALGIYGFGAAAHIITQVAINDGVDIYAFTRPGDKPASDFALKLGSSWAGDSNQASPVKLDAAIIYAPVGELVPAALKAVRKGGRVICAGIHMSNIPEFPYEILWGERQLCSVANLTRDDGVEFFDLVKDVPIKTSAEIFKLEDANIALAKLRKGELTGAAVLVTDQQYAECINS
ncbi:MAG: zinc-dependent alcohol dehydrogenase family protein [Gammaproteobacteria bacterium]|nr:zinc-dependent alcohol dehydrogenase family protein [Gammaproteobacteria bacterium]